MGVRSWRTGVARAAASDWDVHALDVDGGVELTLALVGDVVGAADRLGVAAVADRLQTLRHV